MQRLDNFLIGHIKPGLSFQVGEIAQIEEIDGKPFFVKSNGEFPIGPVSTIQTDMICGNKIWIDLSPHLVETTVYDNKCVDCYFVNSELFVKDGLISRSKTHFADSCLIGTYNISPIVGRVINFNSQQNILQYLWL